MLCSTGNYTQCLVISYMKYNLQKKEKNHFAVHLKLTAL